VDLLAVDHVVVDLLELLLLVHLVVVLSVVALCVCVCWVWDIYMKIIEFG
jgi:hypothetical protein